MNDRNGLGAIRSMDYVILLCDDINKMQHFYTNIFEFQIEDEDVDKWVGFRVGTLLLGLRPRGRSYDGPNIDEKSASVQLSFRVPPDDVDNAYQSLKEKGIDVIEAPTNQDWPHRTLFFSDPENNIIEIFAEIHPKEMTSASLGFHHMSKSQ